MHALALPAVLVVMLAAGEDADTLKKARGKVEAAKLYYSRGRYAEALQAFSAAQALRPAAPLWFNIGKCHEALGDIPNALRSYRNYLREAPDTPDKDQLVEAIARMEKKLRARGVQQLTVLTEPKGARVTIDGKGSENGPASFELAPGTYTVAVSAEGFVEVKREVTMRSDGSKEIEVVLKPVEVPKPEPVADAPVLVPEPAPVAVAPVAVVEQPKVEPARRGRLFTWIAAGLCVAGIGGGAGLGVMSSSARAELLGSMHPEADATALYDRAKSFALYANVSYGVAAAAGIAALVLFFLEAPKTGVE